MKRTHTNPLRSFGMLVGLGLSLSIAAVNCGDDGSSSTSTGSTGTSTGATSTGSEGSGGSTGSGGSGGGGSGGGSTGSTGTSGSGGGGGGSSQTELLSFFVSSTGSKTANLGGLAGADKRCQDLAQAVGAGAKTWHAYLSVEKGPTDGPVNAKDRIGAGPWYNAKLELVAADLTTLHERFGDYTVFLDEKGETIPGQWANSPTPNQHDILTGTNRDGTLAPGKTCADWTSEDTVMTAIVGHSDGLGPNMSADPMYRPWNTVHENGSCSDTAPKGGAGRIYCFAVN
jgi:hypothetical protein